MSICKAIHKYKINEQPNDFSFWQSRSYEERLEALEQIRKEYNSWKYNAEQGLQRVFTEDFLERNRIIQLGCPPDRIDILTTLTALNFEDCYSTRVGVEIQGIHIDFIDIENLRKNKRATGRSQDLADAENLE